MKNALEKGLLARHREQRGGGEMKRIADRVDEIRTRMSRDLDSFSEAEDSELQEIRQNAEALVEKTGMLIDEKISGWSVEHPDIAKAFPTKEA